jgi:hypothetical protein
MAQSHSPPPGKKPAPDATFIFQFSVAVIALGSVPKVGSDDTLNRGDP